MDDVTKPVAWKCPDGNPTACAKQAKDCGSRALREHEHFAVVDLILRKDNRTDFRVYFDFRVGKACLDCSNRLGFVGNGDKK